MRVNSARKSAPAFPLNGEDDGYEVTVSSRFGTFLIRADDEAVTHIILPSHVPAKFSARGGRSSPKHLRDAAAQLREYLGGKRKSFDLPLGLEGTEFQERVWLALADIPYGETISYAELADWVGHHNAFRAVGSANGANPLPIVLPCHRVIASGGGLGGYGGGLDLKRSLLALEGAPL